MSTNIQEVACTKHVVSGEGNVKNAKAVSVSNDSIYAKNMLTKGKTKEDIEKEIFDLKYEVFLLKEDLCKKTTMLKAAENTSQKSMSNSKDENKTIITFASLASATSIGALFGKLTKNSNLTRSCGVMAVISGAMLAVSLMSKLSENRVVKKSEKQNFELNAEINEIQNQITIYEEKIQALENELKNY